MRVTNFFVLQNQPNVTPTPGSPTSRLLLEYEMHLRNTLAKGMDAESYSLHTFEALLSQSMENLGNIYYYLFLSLSLTRSVPFFRAVSFEPSIPHHPKMELFLGQKKKTKNKMNSILGLICCRQNLRCLFIFAIHLKIYPLLNSFFL